MANEDAPNEGANKKENYRSYDYSKEHPMMIRNDVTINFDWKDKLRILFGKKPCCVSKIYVDRFCEIAKQTESKVYVDKIFPKKITGQLEINTKK